MLQSKTRILWIKWHAYLSCFFLPLALLYTLTGALYLLDIEGGFEASHRYQIEWPNPETGWFDREAAKAIILNSDVIEPHLPLPANYWQESDLHGWWGFHQYYALAPSETPGQLTLQIEEYDLWHQLVFIHKGLAGKIFWVLGLLLGCSMLISLVSGAVVALAMPKLRRNAIRVCMLGLASVIIAYFVS